MLVDINVCHCQRIFTDINGIDFWRNHGSIRHLRYTQSPVVNSNQLTFATESELLSPDDETQGRLSQHFALTSSANNWLLVWQATFQADEQPLIFGDQEEMGCGARVATAITEKNGGSILNSSELSTAAATWGQPAQWCNYSGMFEQHHIGITLMAAPENFRTCWWHNRDYGLMVANPFGRAAMKQGGTSQVRVEIGQSLRLCFGACIHQGSEHNLQQTYRDFVRLEGFLPKD